MLSTYIMLSITSRMLIVCLLLPRLADRVAALICSYSGSVELVIAQLVGGRSDGGFSVVHIRHFTFWCRHKSQPMEPVQAVRTTASNDSNDLGSPHSRL